MEEKQHEKAALSKLNIVRAQVFFLLSTISEDKWESNVNQLKEVNFCFFKTGRRIRAHILAACRSESTRDIPSLAA